MSYGYETGSEKALGLVPMVIEQTSRGERSFDIYSRLLKERVVFRSDGKSRRGSVVVLRV